MSEPEREALWNSGFRQGLRVQAERDRAVISELEAKASVLDLLRVHLDVWTPEQVVAGIRALDVSEQAERDRAVIEAARELVRWWALDPDEAYEASPPKLDLREAIRLHDEATP